MTKSFDDLIQKLSQVETKKVAVAVAQDDEVLLAVKAAKERGIADSILVGDADLIKPIADEIGMNLDDYEVVDVKDTLPRETIPSVVLALAAVSKLDLLTTYTKTFLPSDHLSD